MFMAAMAMVLPLKIKLCKVLWAIQQFDLHFKSLYPAEQLVKNARFSFVVWQLVLRTTFYAA
jgi:hypothetical protein